MNDKLLASTLAAAVIMIALWAVAILAVHTFADMIAQAAGFNWNWKGTLGLILLKLLNDNIRFGNIKIVDKNDTL